MPSKKINISKKPKQFSRRARKTGHRGPRVRNNVPQMTGAPAGVSQDIQQQVRFLPSRGGSGLTLDVSVPIYTIKGTEGSSTNLGGSALVNLAGTSTGTAQLNLTKPLGLAYSSGSGAVTTANFISPIFDLIGSAFVRYRVKKCRFDYEPQSATTTGGRVVFAFANDPSHPVLWNSKFPTQSDLLSLSDSIAFAPWRSWSMDVSSRLMRTPYYIFTASAVAQGLSSAEERFSDFGIISCLTTVGTEAADSMGGILYMTLSVELSEFCPISVTRPAMFEHLTEKFRSHADTKAYGRPKPLAEDLNSKIQTRKSLNEEPTEGCINNPSEDEADAALLDYHLSKQAEVDHPVIGDSYRAFKHSKLSSTDPTESITSQEEVAIQKMTASSIEISRLKSQLDQLHHSKTS